MTNLFLSVNKDLFKLGLNPAQILIIAQIMEFEKNTGDCFISNERLAEQLGVSASTIKREMKKLEDDGFIIRETKNIQKGRERHIRTNAARLNLSFVEEQQKDAAKVNLTLPQRSFCSLRKAQFDPIKDKREKNNVLKDNLCGLFQPSVENIPQGPTTPKEKKVREVVKTSTDSNGAFKF